MLHHRNQLTQKEEALARTAIRFFRDIYRIGHSDLALRIDANPETVRSWYYRSVNPSKRLYVPLITFFEEFEHAEQ